MPDYPLLILPTHDSAVEAAATLAKLLTDDIASGVAGIGKGLRASEMVVRDRMPESDSYEILARVAKLHPTVLYALQSRADDAAYIALPWYRHQKRELVSMQADYRRRQTQRRQEETTRTLSRRHQTTAADFVTKELSDPLALADWIERHTTPGRETLIHRMREQEGSTGALSNQPLHSLRHIARVLALRILQDGQRLRR